MKSIFKITLIAGAITVMASCGGKKVEAENLVAPQGTRYFDISKTGMNAFILVPDSSAGILDTVMQSSGEYLVKVGKDFQISVVETSGDINQRKADIASDDVNKLKKYIVDDATTLMWESGIGDLSEFHFYHIAKLGNRSYVFEDIKGEPFSQQAVQKMLDECKQAKEKKVAEKQS
ncbi:MAG TPA: hypothetical protein VKG26_14845 [Bacteroidia bacterium]|nr:hypothetical protein [Bacteroidia bacterium]